MTYQDVVEKVRAKEISGYAVWPSGWPGHNGPATSRYPNIAAVLFAQRMSMFFFTDVANITRELAAAVIEDGEELDAKEMFCLARRFGFSFELLASPKMSVVEPSKNRGKLRRHQLAELVRETDGIDSIHVIRDLAIELLSEMEQGRPVPYVAWLWYSALLLRNIVATEKQSTVRTARIGEATV